MATEWKSQQADGMFYLQFETDNAEKYMLVEKAAQMAIDGKTRADYAEVNHGEWIKADLLLQKLHNLRNDWSNNNIYVDGFKSAISSIEGIVEELTNCGALMDGRGEPK